MSWPAIRPVDASRLALGVTAMIGPGLLLRTTGSADGTWPRRLTRILGARYLVQSTASATVGARWAPEADAAVDVVHAASMLALAVVFPRHRRLALTSAVFALGFAVADLSEGAPTRSAGRR